MVNIVIYLKENHPAKELVNELLEQGLIANASIDKDNISYKKESEGVVQTVNTVITCQTKSILFPQVELLVRQKYGEEIPIYSLPIIQSNSSFDQMIRNRTIKT